MCRFSRCDVHTDDVTDSITRRDHQARLPGFSPTVPHAELMTRSGRFHLDLPCLLPPSICESNAHPPHTQIKPEEHRTFARHQQGSTRRCSMSAWSTIYPTTNGHPGNLEYAHRNRPWLTSFGSTGKYASVLHKVWPTSTWDPSLHMNSTPSSPWIPLSPGLSHDSNLPPGSHDLPVIRASWSPNSLQQLHDLDFFNFHTDGPQRQTTQNRQSSAWSRLTAAAKDPRIPASLPSVHSTGRNGTATHWPLFQDPVDASEVSTPFFLFDPKPGEDAQLAHSMIKAAQAWSGSAHRSGAAYLAEKWTKERLSSPSSRATMVRDLKVDPVLVAGDFDEFCRTHNPVSMNKPGWFESVRRSSSSWI